MQIGILTEERKNKIIGKVNYSEEEIKLWNKKIKEELSRILYYFNRVEITKSLTLDTLEVIKNFSLRINNIFKDNRTSQKIREDFSYDIIQDITVLILLNPFVWHCDDNNLINFKNRKNNIIRFLNNILNKL